MFFSVFAGMQAFVFLPQMSTDVGEAFPKGTQMNTDVLQGFCWDTFDQ